MQVRIPSTEPRVVRFLAFRGIACKAIGTLFPTCILGAMDRSKYVNRSLNSISSKKRRKILSYRLLAARLSQSEQVWAIFVCGDDEDS